MPPFWCWMGRIFRVRIYISCTLRCIYHVNTPHPITVYCKYNHMCSVFVLWSTLDRGLIKLAGHCLYLFAIANLSGECKDCGTTVEFKHWI